jgi:two-component system, OmpR family, phosphate regulon response regulator PhoB
VHPEILIVEDDPEECFILEESFKSNGYDKIACFNDAFQFISYLKKEDTVLPKVVILDYNMPKISGFQLLAFLKYKSQFSEIKVIMYSGMEESVLKVRCLKAGAVDFVKKLDTDDKLIEFAGKIKEFADTGIYRK